MKIAALAMKAAIILPCNNLIHDSFLFASCSPKIDTGGFNTFMSHQVGKQCDIVVFLQEIFSVTVSEGMRINNLLIQSVLFSVVLQLLGNTPCSDALAEAV